MKRSDIELEIARLPEVYVPRNMEKVWIKTSFLLDCHRCDSDCSFRGEPHMWAHIETKDQISKSGSLPTIFFSLRELMRLLFINATQSQP